MPLTCADWLAVLALRLTGPLFDTDASRRLRSLARNLPGECQGTLETRLAPGAAPVDLSLRLLSAAQSLDLAARLAPSPIADLLSLWSEPRGPLQPVRSIWLEFDLDTEPPGNRLPAPVVCAKLPGDVDPGWLTGTLLPALGGRPPLARQRDLILSCLGAMPPSARLLYVFGLQARGNDAVRLEIFGLELAEILDYLGSRAPQTVAAVAEVLPLFSGVERLHLSLDVAEGIAPRIGLEGSFPRQPSREPRWRDLFQRLMERGVCTAEKREALLDWPGYDTFWTAPERWPLAEMGPRGFCVRALSHVKVVCLPDQIPEAKAYLVFCPHASSGFPGARGKGERQSHLPGHL